MIQKATQILLDKELSGTREYLEFLNPEKCYYHLTTNRCKKGSASIEEGSYVKIGDIIGERDGGFFKQNIHSTISGTFVGTEKHLHRSGTMVEYMIIENDFKEEKSDRYEELSDEKVFKLSKEEIEKKIYDNSDIGLGGSGFPTYIKFQTKDDIKKVIINGVECEPYLSSDYDTMMKNSEKIIRGLEFIVSFYQAEEGILTVKEKKKDLIELLNNKIKEMGASNITVCPGADYYPQGYEKDVIKTAVGVEVPPGVMPSQLGYMVFNSTSVLSIYESLKYNMPTLTREFSAIGNGLKTPTNLTIKVGTYVPDIIEKIGGYECETNEKVMIIGGPMMGTSIKSDDIVVTKAFSTFIIMDPVEEKEEPCINCASCVYSCPMDLQPNLIASGVQARDSEMLGNLNVRNCIECGLCSYVCTSKIDLTNHVRRSKRLV